MIVRAIDELMIINDEAHHIHDKDLAWFKSIEDIHNQLLQKDGGLSMQLDVTATPKHNNGAIFVQTVADYPLVEAIAQNVVKHPILPDKPSREKLTERQSAKFTEKYADYLDLGVIEWRKAYAEHEKLGKKAILFVMTDDNRKFQKSHKRADNQGQRRRRNSRLYKAAQYAAIHGYGTGIPARPKIRVQPHNRRQPF